jgi:hypothetical protein
MTVHHAELAKTVRLALSIATHAHRATRVTMAVVSKTVRLVMAHHVVLKTVRQELSIATHVRLVMTAHRALSTVTHAQLVTRAIHATHARQPVATSVATGAQHLLLAAATFSAMTVHHAELAKTVRLALSTVTHAHRATRVTAAVVSKTDHNVIRTSLVQPVLSEAQPLLGTRVTHAQRAMVTRAQQELSTEQNLAAHASSTTDHASLIATTATTAPTVVQTALTVSTATAIVTAPSKEHARATQTRRPSLKIRSLSVSRA